MTSSSPEKLGRSSKSRTKSPCSPHAVGEGEPDTGVLLAEVVELEDLEFVTVEELVDTEPELNEALEEVATALEEVECNELEVVLGPFASELPMIERACVLGDAEDMPLLVGKRETLEVLNVTVGLGLTSAVTGLIEP